MGAGKSDRLTKPKLGRGDKQKVMPYGSMKVKDGKNSRRKKGDVKWNAIGSRQIQVQQMRPMAGQ